MLKKEPSPERAKLGFKEAVLNSFGFLINEGFHVSEQEITFIRYESALVFINVYHGRASFELGVEIGRLNEPNKALTLYDITSWYGLENTGEVDHPVAFQVSSRKGVQEFVPKLAEVFKKYATPLIRGNMAAFTSAYKLQLERSKEYEKEVNLKNVRKSAETAWQKKDFDRVVELLSSIRGDLTQIENKKLAYAEQNIVTMNPDGPHSTKGRKR